LVDESQDGNLAQIDLLPPRKIEQQVKRAFPPVELKIELVFGRAVPGVVLFPILRLSAPRGRRRRP
jgi:hypothetical protein